MSGILVRHARYWRAVCWYAVSGSGVRYAATPCLVQGGEGVGGDRCRANRQAAARLRSVGVRGPAQSRPTSSVEC
eukprot:102967-Rhodomonas_salina.1